MTSAFKQIDAELEKALADLEKLPLDDTRYEGLLETVTRLNKIRTEMNPVDRNTVLLVISNLVGIAAVLSYEHLHIVSSKAFSMIARSAKR